MQNKKGQKEVQKDKKKGKGGWKWKKKDKKFKEVKQKIKNMFKSPTSY